MEKVTSKTIRHENPHTSGTLLSLSIYPLLAGGQQAREEEGLGARPLRTGRGQGFSSPGRGAIVASSLCLGR